jgi:hypothetical protein
VGLSARERPALHPTSAEQLRMTAQSYRRMSMEAIQRSLTGGIGG